MAFLRQVNFKASILFKVRQNIAKRGLPALHCLIDNIFLRLLAQDDILVSDCDRLLRILIDELIRHTVTKSWSLLSIARLHALAIFV